MTKTSYRGTCAWCFISYAATAHNITTKHGWREVGAGWTAGGRKVGEYGNVAHTGNCPGMNYPPYELNTAGTEARLVWEKAGIAACDDRLGYLAAKPTLVKVKDVNGEYDRASHKYNYARLGVRLTNGERVEICVNPDARSYEHRSETFDYEKTHTAEVEEATIRRSSYEAGADLCKEMIKKWSLGTLAEYEPRKATVHLASARGRFKGTYCGNRKSIGLVTTDKAAEVTCSRCLRAMDASAADKTKRDNEKATATQLAGWLKTNGPATLRQIREGLGLDTKLANRAVDIAESGSLIKKDYDATPAKYESA